MARSYSMERPQAPSEPNAPTVQRNWCVIFGVVVAQLLLVCLQSVNLRPRPPAHRCMWSKAKGECIREASRRFEKIGVVRHDSVGGEVCRDERRGSGAELALGRHSIHQLATIFENGRGFGRKGRGVLPSSVRWIRDVDGHLFLCARVWWWRRAVALRTRMYTCVYTCIRTIFRTYADTQCMPMHISMHMFIHMSMCSSVVATSCSRSSRARPQRRCWTLT